MKNIEKLYEVLGEMLYVIAKADGIVQDEEKAALNKIFEKHGWASEIIWSFDYEVTKESQVEEVYNKVINFCHTYGPAPQYQEFIEAMTAIAEAAGGIDERESKFISSFSRDLLARFQRDADKLLEYNRDVEKE